MPFSELLQSASSGDAWLPVVDAVAKATILLALAGVASVVLRRASAASRHLVWTLALVGALLLPVLSLALPRWQLPLVTLASTTPMSNPVDVGQATPPAPLTRDLQFKSAEKSESAAAPAEPSAVSALSGRFSTTRWPEALLMLWFAGALVVLGRLALGLLAVQWMSRRTERVTDAPWLPLARRLAAELGITPRILFLRSERAAMPMAWGVLLPSVLMPADADTWPTERLRIVLLHELAHVKRRDCLTHMLAQIACALYWFNPLAWMAARHVRTERERACDDLVLAAGTRGPDYADQLLEIARVMRAGRYPGVLAGASLAMANRSQLEGRLMAILDPTVPRAGVTRLRTSAAIALVAVALIPLASVQPWVHAAAPMVVAGEPASIADQNPTPTPTPMPTPTPAPTPDPDHVGPIVDGVVRSVVPGAVQGAVEGTLGGGHVQSVIQGSVQGALQGAIQGAIQGGVNVKPDVRINDNLHIYGRQTTQGKADPKTIAALTGALKDSDKGVREAALNALVQLRDPGIFDALVQALSDEAPNVREKAAFGLGQLRDKRAVGALTNALKDTNADVRQQAVFALGQLRDPAAFDAMVLALRDAQADVREQAAFALGQLRDRRAVEPLVSSLKDAAADVREQAAFALGQLRDRAAVEALVIAIKDTDADVREQVAFALGQLRDARAIDALTDALKDASADVRQQAAFALGQIAR
jgi:beta-lactamase regulating signal transducer with metallopeptidase domain